MKDKRGGKDFEGQSAKGLILIIGTMLFLARGGWKGLKEFKSNKRGHGELTSRWGSKIPWEEKRGV